MRRLLTVLGLMFTFFTAGAQAGIFVCQCLPSDQSIHGHNTMLLKLFHLDDGAELVLGSYVGKGFSNNTISSDAQSQCEQSRQTHPICRKEAQ